jgi:hypothetical protein
LTLELDIGLSLLDIGLCLESTHFVFSSGG